MEIIIVAIVSVAAVAVVLLPLVGGSGSNLGLDVSGAEGEDRIDAAVGRYRTALRADTVCRRCLRANPEDSRYCADCGRSL